jgi:hypothetical protein
MNALCSGFYVWSFTDTSNATKKKRLKKKKSTLCRCRELPFSLLLWVVWVLPFHTQKQSDTFGELRWISPWLHVHVGTCMYTHTHTHTHTHLSSSPVKKERKKERKKDRSWFPWWLRSRVKGGWQSTGTEVTFSSCPQMIRWLLVWLQQKGCHTVTLPSSVFSSSLGSPSVQLDS